MGLADRVAQMPAPAPSDARCKFAHILEQVAVDDAPLHADLEEWIGKKRIDSGRSTRPGYVEVDELLCALGYDVSYAAIAKHVRQRCRCYRTVRSTS